MANEKRNLIDRDELIDSLGASDMEIFAKEVIGDAPTVDAVEVVHGHWEYGKWEQGHWVKGNERCRCSVCHRDFAVDNSNIWHGCPQCLAKMDGDGNGNK